MTEGDEFCAELDATAAELAETGRAIGETLYSEDMGILDKDSILEISNPAKKLFNLVLLQAVRDGASDVYFESFENEFKMRYKIDGTLYEMVPPPKYIGKSLGREAERLFGTLKQEEVKTGRWPRRKTKTKITRRLGYGETAGKKIRAEKKDVFLTLSKMPSKTGDHYRIKMFYKELCFNWPDFVFQGNGKLDIEGEIRYKLLRDGGGLVIVSSSPGHGKTTTAYNMLNEKNHPDKLIFAVGGEGIIAGIHQIDANLRYEDPSKVSKILDSFNPDMVYFDDMNRPAVVKMAMDLVHRGSMVIGALDAPDALLGINYLLDNGVNAKQLARVFRGAISQRMVRKIHKDCKQETENLEYGKTWEGKGCDGCDNRGYKGMVTAIQLISDDNVKEVRKYLSGGESIPQENDLPSIYKTVKHLVEEGITTVDELKRLGA